MQFKKIFNTEMEFFITHYYAVDFSNKQYLTISDLFEKLPN